MALDLDIILDRSDSGLLSHQIGRRLIDLIHRGALPSGHRLPSTRQLARQLAVARTTVVDAYEWLCDLGYAETHLRSRTIVKALPFSDAEAPAGGRRRALDLAPERAPPIDFKPGLPDLASFPRSHWAAALAQAARTLPVQAMGYGDPLGHPRLRNAIASYLHRCRGLDVVPGNIVITAGTAQSVDILLRVLPVPAEVIVETPGPHALRRLGIAYGFPLRGVAIDQDGLRTELLPGDRLPRLAHVIPSHQMPLGCVMSMERRLALIAWAKATGAFIVEDDYDSEFAYDGRPSVPLAKLDPSGRVIYAGTFSKTLAPALRIGFIIVPDDMLDRIGALKWWADHGGSTLQQEALAAWIEDGFFERHIHRMRKIYRERFERLSAGLTHHLKDRIRIAGQPVGMHFAAFVETEQSAEAICSRAAAAGLGIYPIELESDARPGEAGFVFGFGNVPDADIAQGARTFASILDRPAPRVASPTFLA